MSLRGSLFPTFSGESEAAIQQAGRQQASRRRSAGWVAVCFAHGAAERSAGRGGSRGAPPFDRRLLAAADMLPTLARQPRQRRAEVVPNRSPAGPLPCKTCTNPPLCEPEIAYVSPFERQKPRSQTIAAWLRNSIWLT